MAVGDFDTFYGDTPFPDMDTNLRRFYERELLRDIYTRYSVYGPFVPTQFDLRNPATTRMTVTQLIKPHVNTDSVGLQTMWIASSRIDSKARDITIQSYADKIAFDKYSNYVTFWRQNGSAGLRPIVQDALGQLMVEKLERLNRNAWLSHPYAYYGLGSATSFGNIGASDVLTADAIDDIWLGMSSRGVAKAVNPNTSSKESIFCITTPGVIMKLKQSDDWVSQMQYARPEYAITGEVGEFHGVRFLQTNEALLKHCGTKTVQTNVTAAITEGSGSPAPSGTVDGVYNVGQAAGVTNYVQLADVTGLAVGDEVAIHVDRTSAKGVTNGVDYTDGTIHYRRIVALPGSNRIALNEPIMINFTTDLGGGVYGYCTKARHINTALFIGGDMGVVLGVTQPPQIYTPDDLGVIDDRQMMYRFSWDAYLGYQLFTPEVFEVWYGAAPYRTWGATQN